MSTTDERDKLTRRGFWLEYASMAWMTAEAAVAITAGIIASSIALVAFGLDSIIEFAAAVIVIWQLRSGGSQREQQAVRLIGVTFFLLAAYLVIESVRASCQPRARTRRKPKTLGCGQTMSKLALIRKAVGSAA